MKLATKPIQRYPPHIRHVATLPWEIEDSNFLQMFYQIWMEMQTNCILRNYPPWKFVSQPPCCVPLQIQTSYQNLVLVAEYHVKHCSDVCCYEFPVPQIDRKSKQVKEQ